MNSRSPVDASPSTVLVLGGRSEIGGEVAARIAEGAQVILAARRSDDLADQVATMRNAGATAVHTAEFDAADTASHAALISSVVHDYGPIDVAVVAFGVLGDQARAEADVAHALDIAHVDYVAQISVLTTLANTMRAAGRGSIIVFSSVAGVRVRRANYVYGSTKAGLDGFASGLSDALHGSGVHLLLARPGFVIGAMTADLMASGTAPAPMSSTAPEVADAVVRALHRRKQTVWIPGRIRYATWLMLVLPQAIWRRMPR